MELDPRKWFKVKWSEKCDAPCEPGCYSLLDGGDILYIGRAKLLWKRLSKPANHAGFRRANRDKSRLSISWQTGWDAYDCEDLLILKWNPICCYQRIEEGRKEKLIASLNKYPT